MKDFKEGIQIADLILGTDLIKINALEKNELDEILDHENFQLIETSTINKIDTLVFRTILYEQRMVHHVESFPAFENQMCDWVP